MESFFDQYRNKAESKTDIPFLEADWKKMEKNLNDQGKPRGPLPFFFWPILAGTLLFSLLVFFKKTNSTLYSANNTLIHKPTRAVLDTIILRDTIYIEKPVYVVRYTEKTRLEDRPESAKQIEDLIEINNELRNTLRQQQITLENTPGKVKESSMQLVDSSNAKKEIVLMPSSSPTNSRHKEVEANPSPADLEVPLAVSLPLAADTLSAWKKLLKSLSPSRLDIGVVAGVPLILNRQIRNKPGYLIGAKLFMAFQSHFEIQAGLTYSKLFYEGHKMDEKLGIPIQRSPIDDLLFTKAEVLRPDYSLDLGLYYSFLNGKRIFPKIGAGIGFILPQISEVSYDFHSLTSPVEWSLDSKFKPVIKNPYSLQWHGALNYKISPRWTVMVQGTLHQRLRSKDLLSKRVDLSTTLGYRLY